VILSLTGRTFLQRDYHLASHRGEVDENALSTFHHTFFTFFLLVGAVGGFLCSGCGSPKFHSHRDPDESQSVAPSCIGI
jgi:hypothetical protein